MSFLASLPPVLQPKEEDIQMMLSAGVHTGTRNSDSQMEDYIWRRRNDGVHVINLGATWSKVCTVWAVDAAFGRDEFILCPPPSTLTTTCGHDHSHFLFCVHIACFGSSRDCGH
jgi:hypothetical protein